MQRNTVCRARAKAGESYIRRVRATRAGQEVTVCRAGARAGRSRDTRGKAHRGFYKGRANIRKHAVKHDVLRGRRAG